MLRFLTLVTQRWQCSRLLTHCSEGEKAAPCCCFHLSPPHLSSPKAPSPTTPPTCNYSPADICVLQHHSAVHHRNLTKFFHLFGEKFQLANKSIIHGISHVKHLEKFRIVKDVSKMSEGWFRSVIGEISVFLFPAVNSSD